MTILEAEPSFFEIELTQARSHIADAVVIVRSCRKLASDLAKWADQFAVAVEHPYLSDSGTIFGSIVVEGSKHRAGVWHCDETFIEFPPDLSILAMEVQAKAGGETEWIDLHQAWGLLPVAWRDAISDTHATVTHRTPDGDRETEHPAVRGQGTQRFIAANRLYSTGIQAAPGHPPLPLSIEDLLLVIERTPSSTIRLNPGDVAIWDNARFLHRSLPYETYRRINRLSFRFRSS